MNYRRCVGLDVMRILLALYVCFFHSSINAVTQCTFGPFTSFVQMGGIAMTGFFMLSGFCLHNSYKNRSLDKSDELIGFFYKRMISILPVYYAVGILYKFLWDSGEINNRILILPVEILGLQSMFSNLFSVSHISGTWFISCILFCYFLFPFISKICNELLGVKSLTYLFVGVYILLVYAPVVEQSFGLQSIYMTTFQLSYTKFI